MAQASLRNRNYESDDNDDGTYMHTRKKKDFNHGYKNIYPYFAPDAPFLRAAPKATEAEELLLKNFEKTNDLINQANVDKELMKQAKRPYAKSDKDYLSGINPRLHDERTGPSEQSPPADKPRKKGITDRIFGAPNRMPIENTLDDPNKAVGVQDLMKAYAEDLAFAHDAPAPAAPKKSKIKVNGKSATKGDPQSLAEMGNYKPAGNARPLVPFFPINWGKQNVKSSNAIFNQDYKILGTEESEIDPTTGAYKGSDQINGGRPTSGKHYSRWNMNDLAKKKEKKPQPYVDPLVSSVKMRHDDQSKVNDMLKKLADYLAEEEDRAKVDAFLNDEKKKEDELPAIKSGLPTTMQTSPKALDRIDAVRGSVTPKLSQCHNEFELKPDEFTELGQEEMSGQDQFSTNQSKLAEGGPGDVSIIENENAQSEMLPVLDPKFINIGGQHRSQPRDYSNRRGGRKYPYPPPPKKKIILTHAFRKNEEQQPRVYKDFDTSLTPVEGGNRNKVPSIYQRTALLDKKGKPIVKEYKDHELFLKKKRQDGYYVEGILVEPFDYEPHTSLDQEKILLGIGGVNSIPGQHLAHSQLTRNQQRMDGRSLQKLPSASGQTRSFWLHKGSQTKPNAYNSAMEINDTRALLAKSGSTSVLVGKTKMMQQYQMVGGRLQPAVKYKHPQPYYNRYQDNGGQEIITYATPAGKIKIGGGSTKGELLPQTSGQGTVMNDSLETQIQELEEKHRYGVTTRGSGNQSQSYAYSYNDQSTAIGDPRDLEDLEKENIDLKEQMIHQMMTLQQYLEVARIWHAENGGDIDFGDEGERKEEFQTTRYGKERNNSQNSRQSIEMQDQLVLDQASMVSDLAHTADGATSMRHQSAVSRNQSAKQILPRRDTLTTQVTKLSERIKGIFFGKKPEDKQIPRNTSTTSVSPQKKPALDYGTKLKLEISKYREILEAEYSNYHIIDIENRIRDNKRIIVNLLTDNIFQLRFGFRDSVNVIRRVNYEDQMIKMVVKRERRIRVLEKLIKAAKERGMELSTWLLHSSVVSHRMVVRVMEDIVFLAQEKNLYLEAIGTERYIKVGEIELKLNWPVLNRHKYGDMRSKGYYSQKMAKQLEEHEALIKMLVRDYQTNETIKKEMTAFITKEFGHAGWASLVGARWLRKKQSLEMNEYDPKEKERIPIFFRNKDKKQDQLPASMPGQFGSAGGKYTGKIPRRPTEKIITSKQSPSEKGRTQERAAIIAEINKSYASQDELDETQNLKTSKVLADKEAEKKRKKDEMAKDLQSEAEIAGGNTTDEGDKPKKSNWMEKIRKEQAAKAEKDEKEKEERAARYRQFLDSSDDEDDDKIDYSQLIGANLQDYLKKIRNAVKAEENLIQAWKEQDVAKAEQEKNL